MKRIQWILSVAAVAALPASQLSCTEIECGVGTIEKDGVCEPATATPDGSRCAEGTTLDLDTLDCVSLAPVTECGPNTTPVPQPDGTILCEGSGGGGCNGPIGCTSPVGGKVSLCGQILDTETGEVVRADDAVGDICDPDNPTADGPCSLTVEFFDPLAFAADPTGTAPLTFDEKVIDDCGRFRGVNVTRPFNGFMAVAVDDHPDVGTPAMRLTGIAFPVEANERRADLRGHVTRITSDQGWTDSAGGPFAGGATFTDVGVYMPVFAHDEVPIEGVVITAGGATKPDDDYYFDDTDPTTRSSIGTGTSTGPSGSGLLTNSSLAQHGGVGGEPAGCEWPSDLAAAIAGVVFFRESEPETDTGEACPTE